MATSAPFLAGQKLTAGQLNDAIEKTLDEVEVGIAGSLATTSGTTELNISQLQLGPVNLVAGALYSLEPQLILSNSIATDEYLFRVRKNTPVSGTLIGEMSIWRPNTTLGYSFVTYDDFISSATETVTLYCSLVRTTGTGTCSIYGQFNTLSRTSMKITRVGYSSALRVVT